MTDAGDRAALTVYVADPASVAVIECSPPSWMVLLALEEKGVPYRERRLSFAAGEHRSPEMLARNPRGTIPVLDDRGRVVHETLAILEYIEFACPGPALMPAEPGARARALTRLHESEALKAAGMALFARIMREGAADASEAVRFRDELARWEEYLTGVDFTAGPALTLADLGVFAYVATAVHLGLRLAGRTPRLAGFHERMAARPSARKTWPAAWTGRPRGHLAEESPEDGEDR